MRDNRIICQPFTALFNLNREEIDGRSISDYLEWLRKTSFLFPGLIIFHDGCLDNVNLPHSRLVRKSTNQLQAFELSNKVEDVIKDFSTKSSDDITFKLPSYALMQMAKFQLALDACSISNSESVLWVDAGISRFLGMDYVPNQISRFAERLLSASVDYYFEVDTRRNIDLWRMRFKQHSLGSSKRVIAGGSFWIKGSRVEELNDKVLECAAKWLEEGVWDNEQLVLREIIPTMQGNFRFIRKGRRETAQVARSMIENDWGNCTSLNTIMNWMMR